MSRDTRSSEKLVKWAEADLAAAREVAKDADASAEQKRIARQLARDAKKRHSRANRRAGKAFCRDYDE
jgi:hypothetical protein